MLSIICVQTPFISYWRITEVEAVPSWSRGEGVGFRAFVLYSGRTYAKQGQTTTVWILNKSVYYEIISKGSQNAV